MPSKHSKALLNATYAFDFPRIRQLVKRGLHNEQAFLNDQEGVLEEWNNPHACEQLKCIAQLDPAVQTQEDALFVLYETLIQAGHPVPDGGTRRCLARIIGQAAPPLHDRALMLMRQLNEQGGLSWASSQWAAHCEEDLKRAPHTRLGLDFSPSSNDLYASAILSAVRANHLPLLRYLCENPPPTLKSNDWVSSTPPHYQAAALGHLECLQYLFELLPEQQWQKKVPSTYEGGSALTAACHAGQYEVAQWLLEHGADPSICPGHEGDALCRAMDGKGDIHLLDLLVKHGALINQNSDSNGNSALQLAIWREKADCVAKLVELGANPHHCDKSGRTPLIVAAQSGFSEAVRLLLPLSDPHAQDSLGYTALHWACANDRLEVFEALLEAQSLHDIPCLKGNTAWDVAKPHARARWEQYKMDQATPTSSRPKTVRF